jgi:hypothetical protein
MLIQSVLSESWTAQVCVFGIVWFIPRNCLFRWSLQSNAIQQLVSCNGHPNAQFLCIVPVSLSLYVCTPFPWSINCILDTVGNSSSLGLWSLVKFYTLASFPAALNFVFVLQPPQQSLAVQSILLTSPVHVAIIRMAKPENFQLLFSSVTLSF